VKICLRSLASAIIQFPILKMKMLISKIEKLNVCNDSISSLRIENVKLNAKIEELNVCKASTSTVENVAICTRCRDVNIEAIDDHLAMIKQQNDHIAKLDAKIAEHELENENFKFARSMLYNRRCPSIKRWDWFPSREPKQHQT
jgi:hypothetical protein